MKSLSKITALVLSVMLIAAIAAAQISYCLHSTLMSSQHLSRLLEDDKKLTELTVTIYASLAASSSSKEQDVFLRQYMAKVLANTDQSWIKSQVYITAKGLHQYIFSEASTLPTLDIIPLKKAIRNVLISEIMKSDQAKQKAEKIQTILSALNNKYFAKIVALGLNNQLVTMLLELSPIRSTGFDKATINEIVRIYISLSNKNISLEEASTSITEQMAADMLRLNEIKDYFDLNLFMGKAFGELDPLKTCRTFAAAADKTVTRTISISLWCIVLLLTIHRRFHLTSVIKAAARSVLIASALLLCISAPLINRPFIEGILSHMYSEQNTLSYILIKYASLFIRDLGLYLALQALITALPCGLLFFLVKGGKAAVKSEKHFRLFPAKRLSLGISVFLLVFIVISFISLSNEYKTFSGDLARLSQTDISQSIRKGLVEAGGMEFLNRLSYSY